VCSQLNDSNNRIMSAFFAPAFVANWQQLLLLGSSDRWALIYAAGMSVKGVDIRYLEWDAKNFRFLIDF